MTVDFELFAFFRVNKTENFPLHEILLHVYYFFVLLSSRIFMYWRQRRRFFHFFLIYDPILSFRVDNTLFDVSNRVFSLK